MQLVSSKKTVILNVLDILRKESDHQHRLMQKDLIAMLKRDYGQDIDRKTLRSHLSSLQELDYPLEYDNGWYYEHEFTDGELRLLVDGVLFSKHMPSTQGMQLIAKLENLSSRYFHAPVNSVHNGLPSIKGGCDDLFLTLEVLDEAIRKHRQVEFEYCSFDLDKELHPRCNIKGEIRQYQINPYRIVTANGWYYLICNTEPYENVSHYRLDRIRGIRLLEEHHSKPMKQVKGLENGLDLPRHMAEHIYMFTGEKDWVTFRANRSIVPDIIDWFGTDVEFSDVTDDEVTVRVLVNIASMRCWAMQYALYVKVLSPNCLVNELKKDISVAADQYNLVVSCKLSR